MELGCKTPDKEFKEPRNFTSSLRGVNMIQMVVRSDLINVSGMPRLFNFRHTLKQLIMDVVETEAACKRGGNEEGQSYPG